MNEIFRQHVEQLHEKFEALMRMEPVTLVRLPASVPKSVLHRGQARQSILLKNPLFTKIRDEEND
jgi:hypothetical protein